MRVKEPVITVAAVVAPVQARSADPCDLRPLCDRVALAFPFDDHTSAPVVSLLFAGLPATIAWVVPSLVVDATQCVVWRAFAHVGYEGVVGIKPWLVDSKRASPADVFMIVRTNASALHVSPLQIGAGPRASRKLNRWRPLRHLISSQAPTRSAGAGTKVIKKGHHRDATVADALNAAMVATSLNLLGCDQPSESLSWYNLNLLHSQSVACEEPSFKHYFQPHTAWAEWCPSVGGR